VRDIRQLYGQRSAEGRALADAAEVARAATFGAVDPLLVDIDAALPGAVDDQIGAVTFAAQASGDVHDVTDEIARRAWLSDARVLAVRGADIPGGGPVAAILHLPAVGRAAIEKVITKLNRGARIPIRGAVQMRLMSRGCTRVS